MYNKSKNYIANILYAVSLIIFLILMSYIAIKAFNINEAYTAKSILNGLELLIFMLLGIIFIVIAIYAIYSFSTNLINKKYLPYLLLLALFLLQSAFVIIQRANLRYDTLKIFDEALAILEGNDLSPSYSNGYFSKYPNNIPLCIITFLLLKPAYAIGIDKSLFMLYLQIINVIMIDIAFIFTYKTIIKIKSYDAGILFLLICLFNPLTYLLSPFYYTHTFSMAFSTGCIYFFLCTIQTKGKLKYVYSFLSAILVAVGFKIRATVFIVFIAIMIFLMLNYRLVINAFKKQFKTYFITVMVFIFSAFASVSLYYGIEGNHVHFDYKESGYPASHWIMLGLSEGGGYNYNDDIKTFELPTKAARNSFAKSEIKNRISTLGIKGLYKHAKFKLELTFSDGTDDFIDNISSTYSYSKKNDLISGQKNDLLVIICHIYNAFIMLFIVISIIWQLYLLIKERFLSDKISPIYIIMLNLLGGIIFHIIWEAGQVYNISFTCSISALAAYGLFILFNIKKSLDKTMPLKFPKYKQLMLCMLTFCITVFAAVSAGFNYRLKNTHITHYSLAVLQDLSELNELDKPLLNGSYSQTFKSRRPFNTIGIKVKNALGSENCSLYKIILTDSSENMLFSYDLPGAYTFDNDFILIEFPTVTPYIENAQYTLTIIPEIVSETHSLTFCAYNSGNYDMYPQGSLYIDNHEKPMADLTFKLYEKRDSAYWD